MIPETVEKTFVSVEIICELSVLNVNLHKKGLLTITIQQFFSDMAHDFYHGSAAANQTTNIYEPQHGKTMGKTNNLHRRKQRHRSASQ